MKRSGFSGLKELFSACCQWLSDVNRSPTGIFDVTIAFLDTENVDFDVQYAILLTFCITLLCYIVVM